MKALVENTIPVLAVRDLVASLAFYSQKLGFQIDWGGEPGAVVASVSRDGCPIMLQQCDAGQTSGSVWIGLEDDSLFDAYRNAGVTVLQEPTNQPWAYEMKIADPDGNVLWLGTEPRSMSSGK